MAQPKCPIDFPDGFPQDRGSRLVDPVTGSSITKTDHYQSTDQCGLVDFTKFGAGTNIIALDPDTCEKVTTAYLTVKGAFPYCTTKISELDALIKIVRDRIVADLELV